MLDYTVAAGKKIIGDVKKISLVFTFLAQLFSIIFLTYCLIVGSGIFAVQFTLLLLSSSYFIFFCIITILEQKRKKKNKEFSAKVKLIYKWSVRAIKAVNLGIVLYGFPAVAHTSTSLLLLVFSLLACVLDIIVGIISFIVNSWLQLFLDGLKYDYEKIKESSPTARAVNFINKKLGVEEEKKPPIRNQELLEQLAEQNKQERAEKKAEAKAEKKLRRQQRVKKWATAIQQKIVKK